MILCHILINAKLKNPISYYESIKKIDFKKYDKKVKNAVIASVLNTETKDVNIEKSLIEESLISNGFNIKKAKKKSTNDCKSLKFLLNFFSCLAKNGT